VFLLAGLPENFPCPEKNIFP